MNCKWIKSSLSLAILSMITGIVYAEEDVAKNEAKLKTIVVTASGYEQDVTQAPASMTVVTREELDKRQYNDITDVLRNTPGVVISGAGSAQTISIRGMGSDYTLFLINGKRQFSKDVNPNGDDSGFEKNILPPLASIERIEIIRGPASTLYGTDAMGGVINIITKKVSDEWSGNFEVGTVVQDSGQSGDIKETSIYLAGPLLEDKLGLQLALNKSEREEDNFTNGFRGTEKESINSRLTYVINDAHDLEFEANFLKQESETSVGKTIAIAKPGGKQSEGSKGRNYRDVYSVTHNGEYSDIVKSKTYLQFEKSENPDRSNGITSGIELETLIANSQWDFNFDRHKLILGSYYKDESLVDKATNQNDAMSITALDRWAFALFAEDTWSLSDRFNLTGGIRYDHDEKFEGNFSPRLYGVYNLNEAWVFKGGVATGYKQPDLKQSSSDVHSITGKGSAFLRGNDNLKPEKSVTYELATAWHGDQSTATLTAFYTDFKDKIQENRICTSANGNNSDASTWTCVDPYGRLDESGDVRKWNFWGDRINVDDSIMQGIEATFETELAEGVNLNANYTFTDTEIKSGEFKGKPLNKMPEHMFNLTVDYRLTDALDVWSRLHYRSETSEYKGRSTIEASTPGYEFLDVGFNYDFNPNLTGKFGVYNLLDERVENASGNLELDGRRYGISFVAKF